MIQQPKKINKDLVELNSTINQLDIINIYWLLHPTTAEYTFFSSSHETITKKDHMLCHKTHINKFKRIKIIQCLLSDHNGIKLEINNRKITRKSQNMWRLKTTLLNNMGQRRNLKKNLKIFWTKLKWKHNLSKLVGCRESSA